MRKLLAALVVVAGLLAVAPLTSAPVPKSIKGSGTIFVWNKDQPPVLNLYTPDGEHVREVKFGTEKECTLLGVSPGGKWVGVTSKAEQPNPLTGIKDTQVHLVPLDDAGGELPEPVTSGWFRNLCWSADGRTAFITLGVGEEKNGPVVTLLHTRVFGHDTVTGKQNSLDVGHGQQVWDVSADGGTFLTSTYGHRPDTLKRNTPFLINARSPDPQPLRLPEEMVALGLHPDGKRVFVQYAAPFDGPPGWPETRIEYLVFDPDTGTAVSLDWEERFKTAHPTRHVSDWSISPNGKRVVFGWWVWVSEPGRMERMAYRLGVSDLDGRNLKVIRTIPPVNDQPPDVHFAWR